MQKILEAFEPLTREEEVSNKFILSVLSTPSNKKGNIDPQTKEMLDTLSIGYVVVPLEVSYYNSNWRSAKRTIHVVKLYNKTKRSISLRGSFEYDRDTELFGMKYVEFNSRLNTLEKINKYKLLHALTVDRQLLTRGLKPSVGDDARSTYKYYRKYTNEIVKIPVNLSYANITADQITFNKQDVAKLIKELDNLKGKLYEISREVRPYDDSEIASAKDKWNKAYINAYKAFNADKHKAAPYAKNGELDE